MAEKGGIATGSSVPKPIAVHEPQAGECEMTNLRQAKGCLVGGMQSRIPGAESCESARSPAWDLHFFGADLVTLPEVT